MFETTNHPSMTKEDPNAKSKMQKGCKRNLNNPHAKTKVREKKTSEGKTQASIHRKKGRKWKEIMTHDDEYTKIKWETTKPKTRASNQIIR